MLKLSLLFLFALAAHAEVTCGAQVVTPDSTYSCVFADHALLGTMGLPVAPDGMDSFQVYLHSTSDANPQKYEFSITWSLDGEDHAETVTTSKLMYAFKVPHGATVTGYAANSIGWPVQVKTLSHDELASHIDKWLVGDPIEIEIACWGCESHADTNLAFEHATIKLASPDYQIKDRDFPWLVEDRAYDDNCGNGQPVRRAEVTEGQAWEPFIKAWHEAHPGEDYGFNVGSGRESLISYKLHHLQPESPLERVLATLKHSYRRITMRLK